MDHRKTLGAEELEVGRGSSLQDFGDKNDAGKFSTGGAVCRVVHRWS